MPTVRGFWINATLLMVRPVLHSICSDEFKTVFPYTTEFRNPRLDKYSHLEALARSLQGIGPWLELQEDPEAVELAKKARCAIDKATNPNSGQFMVFKDSWSIHQALVDAAILAHGMLRAPQQLWGELHPRVKANVLAALKQTRKITPWENNWVLYPAMIEAVIYKLGRQKPHDDRLMRGLLLHKEWYLGGGWWGDGPEFVHNYYNSFVIQPMLYDILEAIRGYKPRRISVAAALFPGLGVPPPPPAPPGYHGRFVREKNQPLQLLVQASLPRTAAYLEALVASDGSFPAVGRSIIYRTAAFHALSLAALRHVLPGRVPPGQARTALTRVINRTLDKRAYDKRGWLRVGVIGRQHVLAQTYSSSGSVYQAAAVFLPLGLPADDPFWTEPDMPTTWEKVWDLQGYVTEDTVVR